jgi:acetoin utilization protein AcuB
MLIKNWMSRPVVTVSAGASMQMARDLMEKHKIRSLPVVRQDKVIGLLTDRDIKRASASDATSLDVYELRYLLQSIKVEKIMSPDPVTIEYDHTLSEAADLFFKDKIEALPVMAGQDELVGILCPSDVARALLAITSFSQRGIELGIRIADQPGATMALVDLVRNAGGRLASLIVTDSKSNQGMREVYIHTYRLAPDSLAGLVEELKQRGTLVYLVDHIRDERKIFSA